MAKGKLVGVQGLADGLGRSRYFVYYMTRCGFRFTHGRQTTVEHGENWLRENPEFRATKAYVAAFEARQKEQARIQAGKEPKES
jgi:hypothetical protein